MSNKREANSHDGELILDFGSEENNLHKKLKSPVRLIELHIGDVLCRIPRGADDETPDDIIFIGGVYLNLKDGRIGESEASVNGYHHKKDKVIF